MSPAFRPPSRIEIAYRRAISDAIRNLIPTKTLFMTDDEWLQHLAALTHSAELFEIGAKIAHGMVTWVNVENAKSWREASARSQRSQYLYRLLEKELAGPIGMRINFIVAQNAALISSIPQDIAERLTGEIARAQEKGARHETIAKMMRNRFPELTKSRINLVARTETAKASTALTRARSEELDLNWFVWRTSHDARVRRAHEHMEGVVVSWNDLPSPERLVHIRSTLGKYAPGDAPNCRCYPQPVLSLEDLYANGSERRKVYANGSIQRLTRAQFAKLSHIESRVAA